jgi:hypothetical protein
MHVSLLRSRVPALVAICYGSIFAVAVYFDLATSGTGPWGFFVILLTFPWSMLLMYVAAWSLAHSGYPLDYYFIPCALLNMIGVFLIAKSATRRPSAVKVAGSSDSEQKR